MRQDNWILGHEWRFQIMRHYFCMQFRAQLVSRGVRDNKMLFSGKAISQVQDVHCSCTLTNLYLVSEAPKNHNKWCRKQKVK